MHRSSPRKAGAFRAGTPWARSSPTACWPTCSCCTSDRRGPRRPSSSAPCCWCSPSASPASTSACITSATWLPATPRGRYGWRYAYRGWRCCAGAGGCPGPVAAPWYAKRPPGRRPWCVRGFLRPSDRSLDEQLVHVARAPVLTPLVAPDDGVPGRVEVLGRVPAGRVVTAPDVPAFLAQPQVDPPAAGREALLAAFRCIGRHVPHLAD